MFEAITENLSKALRNLRGLGKLTEENMAEALGEVRKALLSADVHFKVARDFTDRVKAECVGLEVVKSVTPGPQIVKIISDELEKLLGAGETELSPIRPLKIMMVGLHGSGKTTTSAKLAALLRKQGMNPALVACDVYRPAAIDQLEILGKQIGVPVYSDRNSKDVPRLGKTLCDEAIKNGANVVILDTAGRLQIDAELIEEIKKQRITLAMQFAIQNRCVLVLKDSVSVVALPDGRAFILSNPTSALSKGGSGDVLAGMICSFIAQGYSSAAAAIIAVCLHNACGHLACRKMSSFCALPEDFIRMLPLLLK